jgi:hypothetical protein
MGIEEEDKVCGGRDNDKQGPILDNRWASSTLIFLDSTSL